MSSIKEKFEMVNEHTIAAVSEGRDKDNDVYRKRTITKTFNFLSCRMSEHFETCLYEGRGSSAGGSAAVSSNVVITDFRDLPSPKEVEYMHTKLKELGGNPPDFDDIDFTPATKRGLTIKKQPQKLG